MTKRKIDPYELDEYEQEIEDNMESYVSLSPEETKKKLDELVEMAKSHITARTQVSLTMHTRDLNALKYNPTR